jgi:signal transduction histidine kinase/heme-degrading monooxygenase HmoA
MILAVSRYRMEHGEERPALETSPDRDRLMSQAPGFLGIETFQCGADTTKLLLMTRWSDEASFHQWLSSDVRHAWHLQPLPGLAIDPDLPDPVVLARLEEHALDHEIADAGLILTRFLREARSLYYLRADAQGVILSCNGSWSELLGLSADQLVGHPLWAHLTDRDAEQLRRRVNDRLRRPQDRFLLNVCNAENTPHTLECHLDVRPDGFILLGEPPHSDDRRLQKELGALNRELTLLARERGRAQARAEAAERERSELLEQERQARLEAEKANRIKDSFLGMVSHELRNPLSTILHWAELLATERLDEAKTRRAVDGVLRNVRVQIRLVEDLLDATRISSGNLRMTLRPVDPSAIVAAALEAVRPSAEKKEIVLTKSIEEPTAILQADAERLVQALVNLLGNAVKFTPEQGRVEVRLEISDSEVRFRIADTGPGLDPDLLSTLFEPFRQGSIPGERSSGLGLGLTIAQKIVELHGGQLEAESPGSGQGSVFTIRLPL